MGEGVRISLRLCQRLSLRAWFLSGRTNDPPMRQMIESSGVVVRDVTDCWLPADSGRRILGYPRGMWKSSTKILFARVVHERAAAGAVCVRVVHALVPAWTAGA